MLIPIKMNVPDNAKNIGVGEVAGYPRDQADALVAAGKATYFRAEDAPVPPKATKPIEVAAEDQPAEVLSEAINTPEDKMLTPAEKRPFRAGRR